MQRLISTVRDRRKLNIFYDPEIFNEDVTLSINLSLSQNGEIIYNDEEEIDPVEWNTIHEEGTSFQPLSEIAVFLESIAPKTPIIGPNRLEVGGEFTYEIPQSYGESFWEFEWDSEGPIALSVQSDERKILVEGTDNGIAYLIAKVYKGPKCADCCYREIPLLIRVGTVPGKLLLLRNRFLSDR